MTTRTVRNPNESGSKGFIIGLIAILAIAAVVIGMVFYNGRAQRDEALSEKLIDVDGVEMTYTEGDPYIVFSAADGKVNDGAPTVSLFEDFSCPHCADLAKATDEGMLEKIRAGELVVQLHPMNFLDGQGPMYQQGHSTKALAAELALAADGDARALWNLRAYLLENQQAVYKKLDNDGFATKAKEAGASEKAVKDIREGAFIGAAEQMGQDNADYQTKHTGEAYSPRVMKDDKDLEVPNGDIGAWLDAIHS